MPVFQSRILSRIPGVAHGTAWREGGPMSFSHHTRQEVRRTRERFVRALGAELLQLTLGHQVHGSRVRIVTKADVGAGSRTPKNYLTHTDGLLTQRPDVALGVFTADCMPVLLADPISGWLGAVHVGWRGAVAGILPKALALLKHQGVQLRTLQVWCGPAICATCYVTGNHQQVKAIRTALGAAAVHRSAAGFHIDLRVGVNRQLRAAGVPQVNIEQSKVCTFENPHLPSARRDGLMHENTLSVILRHAAPHDLRGKDVVVFGIGSQGGGEAATHYAVQQRANVTAVDRQPRAHFRGTIKKLTPAGVHFAFGPAANRVVPAADVVIVNPAVPSTSPVLQRARKNGAWVTNDIALFRKSSQNPIIGITGTKGKTTVATWLAYLMKQNHPKVVLAGNVRHSPLQEPAAFDGKTPVVLELSSFQLEHCDVPLALRAAVITNFFPDHLNRHKSMGAYAAVKGKIFQGQRPADIAVLPLDSDWHRYSRVKSKATIFRTSFAPQPHAQAWIANGYIYCKTGKHAQRIAAVARLHRQDEATQRCAITVALTGRALGYTIPQIQKALVGFPGVAERNEVIRRFQGRTFIDNTTATNPMAAAAGIASVPVAHCVCIAGGADKGLPLGPLVQALNRTKHIVLLPGSATERLVPKLTAPYTRASSMQRAVRAAWRASAPSDTITLSPGAASFGLFQNEFDRGEQFRNAVRTLQ